MRKICYIKTKLPPFLFDENIKLHFMLGNDFTYLRSTIYKMRTEKYRGSFNIYGSTNKKNTHLLRSWIRFSYDAYCGNKKYLSDCFIYSPFGTFEVNRGLLVVDFNIKELTDICELNLPIEDNSIFFYGNIMIREVPVQKKINKWRLMDGTNYSFK